jgi:hypothetical protein
MKKADNPRAYFETDDRTGTLWKEQALFRKALAALEVEE